MIPLLPEQGKRNIMYAGIGILILAGVGFVYKTFFYHAPVTGIYASTLPAHGMAGQTTHPVKSAPLQVYDKKKAGKEMNLPPDVIADPREITATATLPPSEGGFTAAAVTDTVTGKTEIIAKEEPRPLFGFGGKTEVGVLAGMTTSGEALLPYVRQGVLRVGPVNLGGVAGGGIIGGKLGAGAFVDVSVRW
jgi:hypothetical protein